MPTTRGGSIGVSSTFAVGIGLENPGGTPNVRLNVYNSGLPTHMLLGNPDLGNNGYTSLLVGTNADRGGYSFLQSTKSAGSAYGDIIFNEVGGNVGIGTNNPDGRLEIKSGVATLKIGFAGDNAHHISSSQALVLNTTNGYFFFTQLTGTGFNPNNYIDMMRLDPGFLRLEGELRCKSVRVTANPWADYVFDKNYRLLPLAEVERFIEKNKHLPEIPSAKEIEKNGQDLGSLQVLQMQKIEELTLYLIAQEKRMQALEQKLLELQKKK